MKTWLQQLCARKVKTHRTTPRSSVRRAHLELEALGSRILPAVSVGLNGGILSITADNTDANVEVLNETWPVNQVKVFGANNLLATYATSSVQRIVFVGGTGHDRFVNSTVAGIPTQAEGGPGNDTLIGSLGNDTLTGGVGNDILTGGIGNDELRGSEGDDQYVFDTNKILGNDYVSELAGSDTLDFTPSSTGVTVNLGQTAAQQVHANLRLTLSLGTVENARGGAGDDTLVGNDVANVLEGGAGNDTLSGGGGNDSLQGGTGNDTYAFATATALGNDQILEVATAAAGLDTVDFSASSMGVRLDLGLTTQTVNTNLSVTFVNANSLENARGGTGHDTLIGDALANGLEGGAGNDTLTGGAGNDTLTGGAGNDTYAFNTNTPLGSDRLVEEAVIGGTDTLDFGGSSTGVNVRLNTGQTTWQTVHANLQLAFNAANVLENARGGAGADWILGNSLANTLVGGGGNDTLDGISGDDFLDGGADDDSLLGGIGNDQLEGGAGFDRLYGDDGEDTLKGGDGNDHLEGGLGNDQLEGGNSADYLDGMEGNDTLKGGDGNDGLYGGDGNDFLADEDRYGFYIPLTWIWVELGPNNDLLEGGGGNDTLQGGIGNDTMRGGEGNDLLGPTIEDSSELGNLLLHSWEDPWWVGNEDGNDYLDGGNGADTLRGGKGNDTLYGGNGNDELGAKYVPYVVVGQYGAYTEVGEDGDDLIYGGSGDDVLRGGVGADTLYGEAGSDRLCARCGRP